MARAVWSGSLTFGLVTLPVQLATATDSHTIRFRQLERDTSDRVRNRRVNERTGEEVPYDRIVKGYDTGEGEYVIIDPEELDEITPGRSQAIEITGFVELSDIDPVYFDTTYFLQPRGEAHSKTYGLLHEALAETGTAGIATMSMRQKEHLVAVHAEGGVLVMQTLHWADEVRDPYEQLDNLPAGSEAPARERKMATQLVEAMAMEWNPHDYEDHTHERLAQLIEAKRNGETVEKAEPGPESTNVVDLTTALRESVDRARKGGGRASEGRASGSRTTESRGGARKRAGAARSAGKSGGSTGRKAGSGGRSREGRGAGRKEQGEVRDLRELSKSELYQRAADAGVQGRSRMNRDELRRALAEVERPSGKRRKAA